MNAVHTILQNKVTLRAWRDWSSWDRHRLIKLNLPTNLITTLVHAQFSVWNLHNTDLRLTYHELIAALTHACAWARALDLLRRLRKSLAFSVFYVFVNNYRYKKIYVPMLCIIFQHTMTSFLIKKHEWHNLRMLRWVLVPGPVESDAACSVELVPSIRELSLSTSAIISPAQPQRRTTKSVKLLVGVHKSRDSTEIRVHCTCTNVCCRDPRDAVFIMHIYSKEGQNFLGFTKPRV